MAAEPEDRIGAKAASLNGVAMFSHAARANSSSGQVIGLASEAALHGCRVFAAFEVCHQSLITNHLSRSSPLCVRFFFVFIRGHCRARRRSSRSLRCSLTRFAERFGAADTKRSGT
jgi:hypothetical protein